MFGEDLFTMDKEMRVRFLEHSTKEIFDAEAPPPWVSFVIGWILFLIGVFMWHKRLTNLRDEAYKEDKRSFQGVDLIRAMISCAVQNDSPAYTVVRFSAECFLFLGGFQINFELTFAIMLSLYAFIAFGEFFCVLLAVSKFDSLHDAINASDEKEITMTTLHPTNVYQNLSIGGTVVGMVFVTQCILISFVMADIYDHPPGLANGSLGSWNGSLGSWLFYVLGIFMACVFLIGPKTGFGQGEGSPVYWMHLILAAKNTGAKITWTDPSKKKDHDIFLRRSDVRLWLRFFMTFLINGYGFHILIHSLPVQVSGKASLTGVVSKAIGMMYLVDLDDAAGNALTIIENDSEHAKIATDEYVTTSPCESRSAETLQVVDDAIARAREDILTQLGIGSGSIKKTEPLNYGYIMSAETDF